MGRNSPICIMSVSETTFVIIMSYTEDLKGNCLEREMFKGGIVQKRKSWKSISYT